MKEELAHLLRVLLDKQLTSEQMRAASDGHYITDNEIIFRTGNRFISRRKGSDYTEIRFYDDTGLLEYADLLEDNTLA